MEEKINSKLLLIGIFSMILTWIFTVLIIYQTLENRIVDEVKVTSDAVKIIYEDISDKNDFKYSNSNQRVTIIEATGNVIYDNSSDKKLENHLSRPEVVDALKKGVGEDTRRSRTLGYKSYYYAVKLSDGNVLRISSNIDVINLVFEKSIPLFIGIGVFILFISVLMSKRLTKNILKPINEIGKDLDNIEKDIQYKELQPFVDEIKKQQIKKRGNEKIRQEFTANVSHELKTPLTSISGYAEMIETGIAKDEDIKPFAAKIHTESGRLINLIGDIIKLSELDEPIDTIRNFKMVDLFDLCMEVKNILEFNIKQNNISFTVDGISPCAVFGDSSMLNELIYNLCDNAIKYNQTGGSVIVKLSKEDNKVTLTVSDTGIGISEENQERIFERFYRVDKSRSKQTGGTGLGLAIVKHVCIYHNAQINVFSEINKGTQVKVVFNS